MNFIAEARSKYNKARKERNHLHLNRLHYLCKEFDSNLASVIKDSKLMTNGASNKYLHIRGDFFKIRNEETWILFTLKSNSTYEVINYRFILNKDQKL